MNSRDKLVDVSVVIPVFNEQDSIVELHEGLHKSLSGNLRVKSFELIFVDDGSTDKSYEKMVSLNSKFSNVKIIRLRRNFGKSAALANAFTLASGTVLFTIDADLQDDPNDFDKLLQKYFEGYDLVTGWKQKRKDSLLRVWGSRLFNLTISCLAGLRLHDYNCGLKLYSKEFYKRLVLYGDQHRFVPMIAHKMGFRVAEVPTINHPRKYGHSKYPALRVKGMFDALSISFLYSYNNKPFHLFALLALPLFIVGASIFLLYTFEHIYFILTGDPAFQATSRPSLLASLIMVVVSVQIAVGGLLGELLMNIYYRMNFKTMGREEMGETRGFDK